MNEKWTSAIQCLEQPHQNIEHDSKFLQRNRSAKLHGEYMYVRTCQT